MTLQELLQNEPYLQTDEKMTGIYLIPTGKFGFTSYPVGTTQEVVEDVPNILPEDFEMPTDISDEEKHQILYHQESKQVFTLDPKAILVTADEYMSLLQHTHCFQDGKIVVYVKSQNVITAEEIITEYQQYVTQKAEAEQWLRDHDYIGVKIAQAMLVGTDEEIIELKNQYASTIQEAKAKRALVNQCDSALTQLEQDLQKAQEVLNNEN